MNGIVVRGIAGRRSEYRAVVSRLVASAEPVAVAEAFRTHLGLSELYLADLDAIAGHAPALPTYRALLRLGFRLWIDAGVRDRRRADLLAAEGAGVVVGLETVAGPDALAEILKIHGDRAVFSLDLRAGVPMGERPQWGSADASEIAERCFDLGVRRLLVLDLARVGVGTGTGTETFCRRLSTAHPELAVWAGGGVRNAADLHRLRENGVQATLVASALHDGVITALEVTAVRDGEARPL